MSTRASRVHLPARPSRNPQRTSVSRRLVHGAWAFVLSGLALAAAPSSDARAQDPVTTRVMVFAGGGFGGNAEVTYDGAILPGTYADDLAATPLAGARVETVFLHYLAFGGQLSTSFWRISDASRRNPMIDLSITPRVRVPFVIDGRFLIEPYVVVPIGFSLAIWNSHYDLGGGVDRVNPGLNVGALAGVTLLTRKQVGAFVEFGWMHHVAYDSDREGARLSLTLNQATLQVGVVYAY